MKGIGPPALVVMAIFAIASPGCGDGSTTGGTTGRASSSSSSGAGGAGGGGEGGGGVGGAGGAQAVDNGAPATEFVSGGDVSKSANYKMVHTLGQPTQNQGKSTSSGYRLQGGLSGANGSLP